MKLKRGKKKRRSQV